MSDGAIDWWMRTGRLHRAHRGVFALGHTALSPEGGWMAAVLACGAGAVLSHRSAAALWRLQVREGKAVEVTTGRGRRGPKDVRVHRSRRLDAEEVTVLRGVPVTTLPRTLADLADALTEQQLGRAIHQAEVTYSLAARALHDAARGARGRSGSGRLARAIGTERDRSRSELERRCTGRCASRTGRSPTRPASPRRGAARRA